MNPQIKNLLDAADYVVYQCNPTVPSAPLAALDEAWHDLEVNRMSEDEWTQIGDVLDAIDAVDWSFWPPEQFGSSLASVSVETITDLAEAIVKFRQENPDELA